MEREIIISVSDINFSVVYLTGDKPHYGKFNETSFTNFIKLYQKIFVSTSNTTIKEYVEGNVFGFTSLIKIPEELNDLQMASIGRDIFKALDDFKTSLRSGINFDNPESIFRNKFYAIKQMFDIFKLHNTTLTDFGERYKNLISFTIKNVARYRQTIPETTDNNKVTNTHAISHLETFASLIYSYTLFKYEGNIKIKLKNLFSKFDDVNFLTNICQVIIKDTNITDSKYKDILKQLTILEGLKK